MKKFSKIFSCLLIFSLLMSSYNYFIKDKKNIAKAEHKAKIIYISEEQYTKIGKYITVEKDKIFLDEYAVRNENIPEDVIKFVQNNIEKINIISKQTKHKYINSNKELVVSSSSVFFRSRESYVKYHWDGNMTLYLNHEDTQRLAQMENSQSMAVGLISIIPSLTSPVLGAASFTMGLSANHLTSKDKGNGVIIEYYALRDIRVVRTWE